jgi:hypothetical protein
MTAHSAAETAEGPGDVACWCCGKRYGESQLVRLGEHPEAGVCFGCAHFLHQRARAREDAARPSPATRARDVLRAGRGMVVRRGWHNWPMVGPVLRRLGSRLP